MNRKRLMQAGILLGCALLAYYLFAMDWPAFFASLQQLDLRLLAPYALLILAGTVLRSARCAGLLNTCAPQKQPFRSAIAPCWHALCAAYLGNTIYPAKAGEVIRMAYLYNTFALSGSTSLTLVFLDRLCDLIGVGLIGACFLVASAGASTGLMAPVTRFCALLVLLVAIGLLLMRFLKPLEHWLTCVKERCASTKLQGAASFFQQSLHTLNAFRSPWHGIAALLWTLAALAADIAALWILMMAFGWQLPLGAAILMQLALSIAGSLPSTPGYVGIYQAAAVLVLSLYTRPQTDGIAYATVIQVANLLIFLAVGLLPLLSVGQKKPSIF